MPGRAGPLTVVVLDVAPGRNHAAAFAISKRVGPAVLRNRLRPETAPGRTGAAREAQIWVALARLCMWWSSARAPGGFRHERRCARLARECH